MLRERQRSGRRFGPSFMAGMNPRPSTFGTVCRAPRKATARAKGFFGCAGQPFVRRGCSKPGLAWAANSGGEPPHST